MTLTFTFDAHEGPYRCLSCLENATTVTNNLVLFAVALFHFRCLITKSRKREEVTSRLEQERSNGPLPFTPQNSRQQVPALYTLETRPRPCCISLRALMLYSDTDFTETRQIIQTSLQSFIIL